MFTKIAAAAALAALLVTPMPAQTAAELLQKGIYTQQTAGDVDAAIQTYRQVIASAGDQRALAGQAQMQIVGALLQKGDLAAAAQEFRILVTDYADQKALISAVTARMGGGLRVAAPTAAAAPPNLTRGTLQNGVYRHNATGLEVTLPPGWRVTGDGMSSGGGEGIGFMGQNLNLGASFWLRPLTEADQATDIPTSLAADIDYKVKQRVINGQADYKVRPETLKPWMVQGQHALSVVGQYDNKGTTMYEYLTFVQSTKTVVFIFGTVPANQIYSYQDDVDRLISGIKIQ